MSFWHDIPKPIVGLSPMDGVTDASFRLIVARHGAPDITFTEFVNVEAAIHAPQILIRDFAYSEIERPIIAQIYGHTPELFYRAAHIVCELGFDGLDINMGCPAKNVAAAGSGAALIRTPELAREIIRATRQGVDDWSSGQTLENLGLRHKLIETVKCANAARAEFVPQRDRHPIPLSVKTRIGYDGVCIEDWIENLLAEKPVAISVHGRTLKQGYKGNADWDAIARAVEIARSHPTLILGNGDLQNMANVYDRVRESGVDGVLLGRAAQGNPWIFRAKEELKSVLRACTGSVATHPAVEIEERFRVILEHARHYEAHVQIRNFVGMRKHLIWYCRDFRGAAELRAKMVRANSSSDVAGHLHDYLALRKMASEISTTVSGPDRAGVLSPVSLM